MMGPVSRLSLYRGEGDREGEGCIGAARVWDFGHMKRREHEKDELVSGVLFLIILLTLSPLAFVLQMGFIINYWVNFICS